MQHFSKMVEFAKVGQPKMGLHNIGASGTAVTKNDELTGEIIGGGTPDKTPTPSYALIENEATKEQKYILKGNKIPTGWKVSKPSGVNINLGNKPASATERSAIAQARASISALNNLHGLFAKAYVGPAAGRTGKVGDVFGFNTKAQSQFNAATAAFKNLIIKQITGAQMGEAEATRILKQVPDVTNPPDVWEARWKESVKNIKFLQKEQLRVLAQSGIKVPSGDVNITIKASDMSDDDLLKIIGE